MDVGPIPVSRIYAYAEHYGYGELFVRQIRAMDRAYLEDRSSRMEQKHG